MKNSHESVYMSVFLGWTKMNVKLSKCQLCYVSAKLGRCIPTEISLEFDEDASNMIGKLVCRAQ